MLSLYVIWLINILFEIYMLQLVPVVWNAWYPGQLNHFYLPYLKKGGYVMPYAQQLLCKFRIKLRITLRIQLRITHFNLNLNCQLELIRPTMQKN